MVISLTTCVQVALGTTSKVFRAMLGPNFAEGQSIRTASAQRPAEIRLPNDDADGMRLLCAALHQRNDLLPIQIEASRLLSFAAMVNKYGCATAVQHTATYFLESVAKAGGSTLDVVLAAYRLDHPLAFAHATHHLSRTADIEALKKSNGSEPLPDHYGQ